MSTAPLILVPFGSGFLALTPEQVNTARKLAQELVPATGNADADSSDAPKLVDAEGMEALTSVPASWWLEQARQKKIPFVRAGKYVRFDAVAATAALETSPPRAAKSRSPAPDPRIASAQGGRK